VLATLPSRLFADRRGGTDRRLTPRRSVVHAATTERRLVVDRRRGAERRSTLDRRGRAVRRGVAEAPGEHVRNALQLLAALVEPGVLHAEAAADVAAALERLHRALELLEPRRS
jgi:hypothetical protein